MIRLFILTLLPYTLLAQEKSFQTKNGMVLDKDTGLIWTQSPDINKDGKINAADKLSYDDAIAYAKKCRVGAKSDWRVPTIKELYSIIDFRGEDISSYRGDDTKGLRPFIDTRYFDFGYGDVANEERLIDAQMLSSTLYTSTTMRRNETVFGVNFADGRIKGYGMGVNRRSGKAKTFYVYLVRGKQGYGENKFVDNKNGTITDKSSGLMWSKADSGEGMNWNAAITYAKESRLGGYSNWRLPTAQELQYIVDYSRSPDATQSAAIDPIFSSTSITNEANQKDYPAFWTSTTHLSQRPQGREKSACYICFGRAMGCMNGTWMDVHGAGSQRSDPKQGDASRFPQGRGPQGDAIRIDNYVRLVRDIKK